MASLTGSPVVMGATIGVILGWTSVRMRAVFFLILAGGAFWAYRDGDSLMRGIDLRGVSWNEMLGEILSHVEPQMLWLVVTAFATALILHIVLRVVPIIYDPPDENRQRKRKRVFADFDYEDDLTRALDERRQDRNSDAVVIPWAADRT